MIHFYNTRLLVIAIFSLSSAMVFLERIDSWYCRRMYITCRGQHQYFNKNNEPVFGGAKYQSVLCYCVGLIGFIWRTVLFCNLWLLYINIHIHYRKKLYNIWKALWKHSYLASVFAENGLAPTTNKYRYFNVALPCSVIGEKWNLQCPKFKIYNRLCRNVWFFYILLPKISNSFQGIHHDIVNLWTIYEYSIIRYWHHAKYATSHRIILWALKKKYHDLLIMVS